jgi:hypothetical protein
MRPIGFSTGAIAKGDFRRALAMLAPFRLPAVELSALRLDELPYLAEAAGELDLAGYRHVSVHAPSNFSLKDEQRVVGLLRGFVARGWPVVVHPDVIFTDALWVEFRNNLLIENNDKRKPVGRTAAELAVLFGRFPEAGLCFDVGHARQIDPTMNEAYLILQHGQAELRQVHISEVNSFSRHDPLSSAAIEATRRVADLVPDHVPVILETLIDQGQSTIEAELHRASEALISVLPVGV